jgi:GNAT superfamily N-acetyltransferase
MQIFMRERLLPQEDEAVNRGFEYYNKSKAQVSDRRPIALTVYGSDGQLAGALDGHVFFDWLTVSRLWVSPDHRGRGTGAALLLEAESRAKSLGCVGSTLSTYDFQAKPFYEKHGYQVFGVLANNPIGHDRFFMSKSFPSP